MMSYILTVCCTR